MQDDEYNNILIFLVVRQTEDGIPVVEETVEEEVQPLEIGKLFPYVMTKYHLPL